MGAYINMLYLFMYYIKSILTNLSTMYVNYIPKNKKKAHRK